MSTITKEWLQQKIAEIEATRDDIPFGLDEDDSNTLAALRIALAALEAEAVGEVVLGEYDDCGRHPDARLVCIAADGQADWENFKDGTLLYSVTPAPLSIDERAAFNAWNNEDNLPIAGVGAKNAAWLAWQARAKLGSPPAPVVPDDLLSMAASAIEDLLEHTGPSTSYYSGVWADVPGKLRAAMLQAGNHTEQHLDMVDHSGDANEKVDCRLTFDQWLSQQNEPIDVDCGCVSTEAFYHWLRVAYEAGNSPVTADCWIPVSDRMPEAEGRYWCYVEEQNSLGKSHYQWNCSWNGERWWVESDNGGCVTHWMELPAAPQQKVKP